MADIKINKQQWDALSQEDQKAISEGLRSCGSLKIGDRIIGDSSIEPIDENTHFGVLDWNPIKDACKALCDGAAASAAAWCTVNTGGPGLAVCLAAAAAARQECRKRC